MKSSLLTNKLKKKKNIFKNQKINKTKTFLLITYDFEERKRDGNGISPKIVIMLHQLSYGGSKTLRNSNKGKP